MEIVQGDESSRHSDLPRGEWDPHNFEPLVTLGKGNYATIYLVESSQTKQLYAMKARLKRLIVENSETDFISTEIEILKRAKKAKHPFVVEVYGGFQTRSSIILYLEFCQGGSLMRHLISGQKFSVERTR